MSECGPDYCTKNYTCHSHEIAELRETIKGLEAQLAAARDALDACDHSDDDCGLKDYKCVRCVTFEALSAAPLAPPVDRYREEERLFWTLAYAIHDDLCEKDGHKRHHVLCQMAYATPIGKVPREALAHPSEGGKEAGKCVWKEDNGCWETGCGHMFCFDEDGAKENGFKFCYSCGKPLVIAKPRGEAEGAR